MFKNALKANPQVKNWDTKSLVYASEMFAGCRDLELDLTGWETPQLKDSANMFKDSTFKSLAIKGRPGHDNTTIDTYDGKTYSIKNRQNFKWPSFKRSNSDKSSYIVVEHKQMRPGPETLAPVWRGSYDDENPCNYYSDKSILVARRSIDENHAYIYKMNKSYSDYKPRLKWQFIENLQTASNPDVESLSIKVEDLTNKTHKYYSRNVYGQFTHKDAKRQHIYKYTVKGRLEDRKTKIRLYTKSKTKKAVAARQNKFSISKKDGKLRLKVPYTKNLSKAKGFYVYRKRYPDGEYKRIGKRLNKGKTRYFTDKKTYNANKYTYKVRPYYTDPETGKNIYGRSRYKSKKYFNPPKAWTKSPSSGKGVTIRWKQVTNATGYNVYKWNTSQKKYVRIKSLGKDSRQFTDRKTKKGKKYSYKVKAKRKFSGAGTLYSSYSKKLSRKAK